MRAVKKRANVRLSTFGSEFYSQDLSPSISMDFINFNHEHCPPEVEDGLSADMFLPSAASFNDGLSLPFSWYGDGGNLKCIRSTGQFRKSITVVRQVLKDHVEIAENFVLLLEHYEAAIKFSEEHRHPIFWDL